MYSEIEYIDPNYRQNLLISLLEYPRGYTGATMVPMTVHHAEILNESFPDFVPQLRLLGATARKPAL